ncbi:MAG: hypothetical protein R3D67_22105 [Hyphomicrobiaceae bacterium]
MPAIYRPFHKQWLYYNRALNERVCKCPHLPRCGGEEPHDRRVGSRRDQRFHRHHGRRTIRALLDRYEGRHNASRSISTTLKRKRYGCTAIRRR